VQVDPMTPKLKPPGSKRLKLNCDILLSTSAFKINLSRSSEAYPEKPNTMLGLAALWCTRVRKQAGAYTRSYFIST